MEGRRRGGNYDQAAANDIRSVSELRNFGARPAVQIRMKAVDKIHVERFFFLGLDLAAVPALEEVLYPVVGVRGNIDTIRLAGGL